jgi:hypothetical protein
MAMVQLLLPTEMEMTVARRLLEMDMQQQRRHLRRYLELELELE